MEGSYGPRGLAWGPLRPAYAAEWEASGRSFPVLAAQCWKILMDAFAAARELVPGDQWLDVRFEDVLADPHGKFKEMLAFMGLDEHPAVHAALARVALAPDRQQQYRRQLDPASVTLVEQALARHLPVWGYEPTSV